MGKLDDTLIGDLYAELKLVLGAEAPLSDLSGALSVVANKHVQAATQREQELSRIREGKLAQEAFGFQRALHEIARVCGLPQGMNLVTAVPKLASKIVVDLGWTQEQNGHLAALVNATAGERDQARADLAGAQAELAKLREETDVTIEKLRQEVEQLARLAYPAPSDGDDRVLDAGDLADLTAPLPS